MKTKETMQAMTKLEHKETHIMSQYEQGYKSGFEFGKDFANGKHLYDLIDAKINVEKIVDELPRRGFSGYKNLPSQIIHIFDVLIEKCGGENETSNN